MIKGIIFDFDGTIFDSVNARVRAWKLALKDYGANADEEAIRRDIGIPGVALASKYVSDPYGAEMVQEQYFIKEIDSVKLFPDVSSTFDILRRNGIKIAIVTSTRRIVMNRFSLNVDTVITIDDVTSGKPSTEPYEKAVMNIGTVNGTTMVVGDIENDLVPARKMGCTSVLVKHGRKTSTTYADYEVQEIGDILTLPVISLKV